MSRATRYAVCRDSSERTGFSLASHCSFFMWCSLFVAQGTNCFPLSSAFSTISSQLGAHSSSSASAASGQVVIAPKSLKPAPATSSFTPIAPDTEMK
jgi:hypothetical protein